VTNRLGIALLVLFVGGFLTIHSRHALRAQSAAPTLPAAVDGEGLVRLAPRLDSRRADIKAFEFKGSVAIGADALNFHCAVAAPRRACVILVDQVPIFVAADDQLLLYDPFSGPHLWRGDWRFGLGGRDSMSLEILSRGHSNAGTWIDVRAIVEDASKRRTATEIGGSRYLLTASTPDGGELEAWIDVSRQRWYIHLTASPPGEQPVRADVWLLSVDEPIDPRAFVFPRFTDHVPLSPPTEITLENLSQGMSQMGNSLLFHALQHDPPARAELERQMGRSLDWADLQQREATMAPLLRRTIEMDSALRPPGLD
jgi:hypothetical protein